MRMRRSVVLVTGLLASAITVLGVTQGHADDIAPPRDPATTVAPRDTPDTTPPGATATTTTTTPSRTVQPPPSAAPVPSLPPDTTLVVGHPCEENPELCDIPDLPDLPDPQPAPTLPPDTTLVVGNPCEENPELCDIPDIPDLPQPLTKSDPTLLTTTVATVHAMLELFTSMFDAPPTGTAGNTPCAWVYLPFVGWYYYCPPPPPPPKPGGGGTLSFNFTKIESIH